MVQFVQIFYLCSFMNNMKNNLLLVLFTLVTFTVSGQLVKRERGNSLFSSDTTRMKKEIKIKLSGDTKFTDYKIISIDYDTTFVDTTLTLQKDFKFNYTRKDDFELLPFHNQGQTYNKLGYNFENNTLFPEIGITAKQYNYKRVEDISYYYVPTPTTELMYKTGLEQGQMLDAFLTMNLSKQLNVSIAYKGLRSLGKYRNALASHGNFRTTFNYQSKTKKYFARGHFSSFDLFNTENGGLTEASIFNFESGNSNYIDRARLDVNFDNTDNMFEGKRYYVDQNYSLISRNRSIKNQNNLIKKDIQQKEQYQRTINRHLKDTANLAINQSKIDSLSFLATAITADTSQIRKILFKDEISLQIGHILNYETKHYRFNQSSTYSSYGDTYDAPISDHTSFQQSENQIYAKFKSPIIGKLKAKISHYNYNYHYTSVIFDNAQSITVGDKLKGNAIAFGADWKTNYKSFFITANGSTIVGGDITGSSLKASAFIKKDSSYTFKGFAEFTTKTPDLNKQLYQSDYKKFNWQNSFSNEDISNVGVEFLSNKWGLFRATYTLVDNYTYFNENALPTQANKTLHYFKIKANKAFTLGKFTLDNTAMYQKVAKGESFFKVPEFVTRNSLYFADHLFKGDPLYLQTGVTFKYFTAFNASAYNPLLSEFTLQNTHKIGNYPIFDFFVNAQIQRTRLYFKLENFSASFTGRNYYTAPTYPYRDLTVRFGLVWNFFI